MISNTFVEHIDEIKTICDIQLGQDYISRKRIITAQIGLVIVDDYPVKVVGWASADIINEKLAKLSQCVIRPGYERRGYATRLVQERLRILSFRGIRGVYANCWKHQDGKIPMEGILTKFGFKPVKLIKQAFAGSNCKFCGDNCKCDCVVFFKK